MQLFALNAAALAVALIYYTWRAYGQKQHRKVLPERVAYMLWIMAERVDQPREMATAD